MWLYFNRFIIDGLHRKPRFFVCVRITDSQKERIEWGAEEVKDLGHLVERIISQNLREEDCGEQLIAMSRLWESLLEAQQQLKQFRRTS